MLPMKASETEDTARRPLPAAASSPSPSSKAAPRASQAKAEAFFQSAMDLFNLAVVLDQQAQVAQALEVFLSAKDRFRDFSHTFAGTGSSRLGEAAEKAAYCEERLGELARLQAEDLAREIEEVCEQAEADRKAGRYADAGQGYIEAVDLLTQLGSMATAPQERAQLAGQVMELLNRAEQMKAAAAAGGEEEEDAGSAPTTTQFARRISASVAASASNTNSPRPSGSELPMDALEALEAAFGSLSTPQDSPRPSVSAPSPSRDSLGVVLRTGRSGRSGADRRCSTLSTISANSYISVEDGDSEDESLDDQSMSSAGSSSRASSSGGRRPSSHPRRAMPGGGMRRTSASGSRLEKRRSLTTNFDSNGVTTEVVKNSSAGGSGMSSAKARTMSFGNSCALRIVEEENEALSEKDREAVVEEKLERLTGKLVSIRRNSNLALLGEEVNNRVTKRDVTLLDDLGAALEATGGEARLKNLQISTRVLDVNAALCGTLSRGIGSLKNLVRLDLSESNLTTMGIKALARALRGCPKLISLNLSDNPLGDDGVEIVAKQILVKGSSVKQLVLCRTMMGGKGCESLLGAILNETVLYQLDLRDNLLGCEAVESLGKANFSMMTHIHVSTRHAVDDEGQLFDCVEHKQWSHVEMHGKERGIEEPESARDNRRLSIGRKLKRTFRRSRSLSPSTARRQSRAFLHTSMVRTDSTVAQLFEQYDTVQTADIVADYQESFADAQTRVTTPNLLLAGMAGSGKTSVAKRAFGIKASTDEPDRKLQQYHVEGLDINVLDSKGIEVKDVGEAGEFDTLLKRSIERLQADENAANHVHAIWLVVADATPQTLHYAKHLFVFASQHKLPVLAIISHADKIGEEALGQLRDALRRMAKGRASLKGIFSTVSDSHDLRQVLETDMGSEASSDEIDQRLLEIVADLSFLGEAERLTMELLPNATKDSVVSAQRVGLRVRELAAADLCRSFWSKLATFNSKTRPKPALGSRRRQLYSQLGKMVRRLSAVWGFLRSDDADKDELLGRGFAEALALGDEAFVDGEGYLDVFFFIATGVLWSVHLKSFTLSCLKSAADGEFGGGADSALDSVLRRATDARRHLREISTRLKAVAAPSGAQPQSSAISQVLEEVEDMLRRGGSGASPTDGGDGAGGGSADRRGTMDLGGAGLGAGAAGAGAGGGKREVLGELVRVITAPEADDDTRDGFFTSFRTNIKATPAQVARALSEHFVQTCGGTDQRAKDICKKICCCFQHWLDLYFEVDFLEKVELTADEEAELFNKTMQLEEGGFGFVHELMDVGSDVTPMVVAVVEFARLATENGYLKAGTDVKEALQRAVEAYVRSKSSPAAAKLEMKFSPLKQFDSHQLACQLTFIDAEGFFSLKTRDFMGAHSGPRSEMIACATRLTYYVVESIVSEMELEERVRVMKKWIEISSALHQLRNWHCFMAVMAGLQFSSVRRLAKTFAALEAEQPALMELYHGELTALTDPGSGIYEKILERVHQNTGQPSIPYLGSFLTLLERAKAAAADGGSGDVAEAAAKRAEAAKQQQVALKAIIRLQQHPYNWDKVQLVSAVDEFFRSDLAKQFADVGGKARMQLEDRLHELSLKAEPREPRAPRPPVESSEA